MVQQSEQASEVLQRQIVATADQVRLQSAENMIGTDSFSPRFDKFLALTKRFIEKGHTALCTENTQNLAQLKDFNSYEQFEDWIFQPKLSQTTPNAVHEKVLFQQPWNDLFTTTEKIKISGWITTLLKFERIAAIRHKVRLRKSVIYVK